MKIEVYGNKLVKEKLKKKIINVLKHYPIIEAHIYLKNTQKECLNCMYFPCKEKCKYAK